MANGYQELIDPLEQKKRFLRDNQQRQLNGAAQLPMPEELLLALEAGMPMTSGVAVGLDRLLMKLTGSKNLADVLSFPWAQA